ncbi:MAG: hypothetical protein AB1488_01500 [Nitrospirota bacterium]
MLKESCPGSERIKKPAPEDIKCRLCGETVEIWSDEVEARCKRCGFINSRVPEPSCIDWCPVARQCVGDEKYERLRTK